MAGKAGFLVGDAVGASVRMWIVAGDARTVVALFEAGAEFQSIGLNRAVELASSAPRRHIVHRAVTAGAHSVHARCAPGASLASPMSPVCGVLTAVMCCLPGPSAIRTQPGKAWSWLARVGLDLDRMT